MPDARQKVQAVAADDFIVRIDLHRFKKRIHRSAQGGHCRHRGGEILRRQGRGDCGLGCVEGGKQGAFFVGFGEFQISAKGIFDAIFFFGLSEDVVGAFKALNQVFSILGLHYLMQRAGAGDQLQQVESICGELTYEVGKDDLLSVAAALREEGDFSFEMLVDLCGVDYLQYGHAEWQTRSATDSGFSRGVTREVVIPDPDAEFDERRFAVVYHLLSVSKNKRLRLRVFTGSANPPVVPSVVDIWSSANWYEREAFDLFGILFEGHPDLRRILTDYGFIGHPFRKDFPLSGNVEVIYDEEQKRVVYQPVSIEPRTLVPRTIRDDNRYSPEIKEHGNDG